MVGPPSQPTDADWQALLDEGRLTEARRAAESQFRDLTSDQISYLRKRAKNDLFFLASGPLEYDLLSVGLHGDLCRWLARTRNRQYRLILLARGHYKSTLCTISEGIQMALPNDAEVQEYPWNLGPNIKILLGHEKRESSALFLYEIAKAFTEKPLMLALFPECIPEPRRHRINKWEFELPRTQHHKEPTFDTIGTGGAAQGRHYHRLKLDDLIGEEARESETVMKRSLRWFDNINSLLTRLKIDGWDLIGTRWSYADIYDHAMKRYGVEKDTSVLIDEDEYREGLIAAYVRGAIEDGEPVFGEEFTLEKFEVLRQNRLVWAAQYANNPKDSGLTEFDPAWLKYYNVAGQNLVVFDGESSRTVNKWDLDRVILVDPSVGESEGSDESGIVITGTDKQHNVYVLETIRKRLRPPELIDLILKKYTEYMPRLVSIEKVTFSAVYRYWLEQKAKERRITPSFYDYVPGSKRSKEARVRGLTNYFAAGQVYILEGMYDLLDEYESFPLGTSDHLLDALAQGPEVWTPGLSEREWDDYRKAEDQINDIRDSVTGY